VDTEFDTEEDTELLTVEDTEFDREEDTELLTVEDTEFDREGGTELLTVELTLGGWLLEIDCDLLTDGVGHFRFNGIPFFGKPAVPAVCVCPLASTIWACTISV
jgi:hypothetical protein